MQPGRLVGCVVGQSDAALVQSVTYRTSLAHER
jgi:hypothetical protein